MKIEYKKLEKKDDYHFISAVMDVKVIGFSQLIINHDITETIDPFSTFWSFCVKKEYRGNGIGQKILAYAEKFPSNTTVLL